MGTRIVDETNNLILASCAEEADTHWSRFRGLMGRRRLEEGSALIIRPCKSIHMMFMRFPVDAVFFDGNGTVTRVAQHVRPWIGMAWGGAGASAVIELPAGTASEVQVGDTLQFES